MPELRGVLQLPVLHARYVTANKSGRNNNRQNTPYNLFSSSRVSMNKYVLRMHLVGYV